MVEPGAKTARMAAHGLRLIRDRLHEIVDHRETSSEDVDEMVEFLSVAIATLMSYDRRIVRFEHLVRTIRKAIQEL